MASALWALMDSATRRVVFPEEHGIKIRGVHTGREIPLPAAPGTPSGEANGTFTVPYSYVDLNGHMNNTRDFDLAEDHMPEPLRERTPIDIRAEYAKEAKPGETIALRSEFLNGTYLLCGESGGQRLFRLGFRFADGSES